MPPAAEGVEFKMCPTASLFALPRGGNVVQSRFTSLYQRKREREEKRERERERERERVSERERERERDRERQRERQREREILLEHLICKCGRCVHVLRCCVLLPFLVKIHLFLFLARAKLDRQRLDQN
jgi:hypothetical protein